MMKKGLFRPRQNSNIKTYRNSTTFAPSNSNAPIPSKFTIDSQTDSSSTTFNYQGNNQN